MKLIKELGNKFQRDEKQQNIQKENVNILDKNRINKSKKTWWKTSPQNLFFSCKK
jgi:hypothetical protein